MYVGVDSHKTAAEAAEKKKDKKKKLAKKRALATLSFGEEAEDEGAMEAEKPVEVKKKMKNPNAGCDFLPDKAREAEEANRREQRRQEWLEEQERVKSDKLEVIYSYWDGSGHRRSITVTKVCLERLSYGAWAGHRAGCQRRLRCCFRLATFSRLTTLAFH